MKLNEGLSPKFIGPKAPVITEEKMMNKIFNHVQWNQYYHL